MLTFTVAYSFPIGMKEKTCLKWIRKDWQFGTQITPIMSSLTVDEDGENFTLEYDIKYGD